MNPTKQAIKQALDDLRTAYPTGNAGFTHRFRFQSYTQVLQIIPSTEHVAAFVYHGCSSRSRKYTQAEFLTMWRKPHFEVREFWDDVVLLRRDNEHLWALSFPIDVSEVCACRAPIAAGFDALMQSLPKLSNSPGLVGIYTEPPGWTRFSYNKHFAE